MHGGAPLHVLSPTQKPDIPSSTSILSNGRKKELWNTSMSNYIIRLSQGVGDRVSGTNTVFFIPHQQVPAGRKVTYLKQEASIRPHKAETHRVCNCIGGNRMDYLVTTETNSLGLTIIKVLLNSKYST